MVLITAYLALCVLVDYYSAQAIVDLEPSGVLYVCHVGGTMSVTCRTSADLLQWNVTLLHPSPQRMFVRQLSYIGTAQMEQPIKTNLTTLSISRSLDNSSHLPLVSTVSTDNVTIDLNGTMITCSGMSLMMGLSATDCDNVEVIILTGMMNIRSRINNVAIPSISEQFRAKDISVTLEWTGTNGVSYNISVDPEVVVNSSTGRNSAQLILSYDTRYNVSVVAALCGITTTNFAIIHHVTCPPLDSDNSPSADRVPPLVGRVTTFSCPAGMVLTGSNVTTCTTNGQWYPDQNIVCKAVGANYLIISLSSSFGVLVVLTVMIILPIIIIILLFKRKGLCHDQRNTPTSEHGSYNYSIGGGQVNLDDSQGEYSSGAKQLNEQQSNIKSTYSLVQPYPPEDDNDQQTNSNASTKFQPKRLVYTDVVPFQQEELRVCPFDPNNKIQYSELKGPSNDFPMQIHSADHKISLESLLVQLKSAILSDSDKWYQLGKALGTKKELLDKCTRLQPDQSLAEILDDWLRNHSGQPSWPMRLLKH